MNKLAQKIAKKTGLGKYETDALLKTVAFEIVEILRQEHRFRYDGLGLFFCTFKNNNLSVKISLSPEAYARLNKLEEGERKDEIIFE